MGDVVDASSLDPIPLQLRWLVWNACAGLKYQPVCTQILVVKAFVEAPSSWCCSV